VEGCRAAGAVGVTAVGLHLRPGVREHYLAWLSGARPELMDLYLERFRNGAYQPRRQQQRLSALVSAVMGDKPSSGESAFVTGPAAGTRYGAGAAAKAAEPDQLALFTAN
jgi:hypothetical protein